MSREQSNAQQGRHRKDKTMEVKLKVYDGFKYSKFSKLFATLTYTIDSFEVVADGAKLAEIECDMNEDEQDELHEYLVLYLSNGETSTFCNSHVNLFRI